MAIRSGGDLVDFIEKDDAVLLDVFQGLCLDFFVIDKSGGFFIGQKLECLPDFQFSRLALAVAHVLEHALNLLGQFLHAGRCVNLHVRADDGQIDFDFLVVEFAFAQFLAEFLACRVVVCRRRFIRWHGKACRARLGEENVEYTVFGGVLGAVLERAHGRLAPFLDRSFDEVADDGVDITPDITDFGKFGGFDLDEGCIGQTGQATGNFRLANAGWADHQNVFRRDFTSQRFGHPGATPAVTQGNGDGAFGSRLADDMFVEFRDDLGRGHLAHWSRVSIR